MVEEILHKRIVHKNKSVFETYIYSLNGHLKSVFETYIYSLNGHLTRKSVYAESLYRMLNLGKYCPFTAHKFTHNHCIEIPIINIKCFIMLTLTGHHSSPSHHRWMIQHIVHPLWRGRLGRCQLGRSREMLSSWWSSRSLLSCPHQLPINKPILVYCPAYC